MAYREFADALRTPPLDVLLDCESWQVHICSDPPADVGRVVQGHYRQRPSFHDALIHWSIALCMSIQVSTAASHGG